MRPEGEFAITADAADASRRLDVIVADRLSECSRSHAAALIQSGDIRVGGLKKKPGYRVHAGDVIHGSVPPFVQPTCSPEPIPLEIVFEDAHIIVVNKPAGMVVHPAPGNYTGTLVHGLLHHCPELGGVGGEMRPGIVHRLDKNTSGVILVAKSRSVHARLSRQFKARDVKKEYLGLVYGVVSRDGGEISLPIGRHPVHRKKMSVTGPGGRSAVTIWRVLERFSQASLLQLDLKTGRTHQLRVHCAAMHHPLVGDDVYGPRRKPGPQKRDAAGTLQLLAGANRQMLHAHTIALQHPATGRAVSFTAPLPEDMHTLLQQLAEDCSGCSK